jgi:hypothetical protein
MKYLKKYKLWESIQDSWQKRQEIIETLIDRSQELWDEDFNVQISSEALSRNERFIKVSFQKKRMGHFFWSDIEEVANWMTSYVESEGLNIKSFLASPKTDEQIYQSYPFQNSPDNISQEGNFDKLEEYKGELYQLVIKFNY